LTSAAVTFVGLPEARETKDDELRIMNLLSDEAQDSIIATTFWLGLISNLKFQI